MYLSQPEQDHLSSLGHDLSNTNQTNLDLDRMGTSLACFRARKDVESHLT